MRESTVGRHVESGGAQIHYEVTGTGPTVLLTHGFGETSRAWDGQVRGLADAYRMVTWDLRGHGATVTPDIDAAYSHPATLDDMVAVLDAVGAPQAVVGGLSLGGFLSLALALAHPERVAGLLLFNTGPGYRDESARGDWNAFAERIARRHEQASNRGLARAARRILTQSNSEVIDFLPAITVPTLVLVGECDRAYRAPADYMAAKIPGARKVVIRGAGHHAHIEQAEAVNDAVRRFLEAFDNQAHKYYSPPP